MFCVQVFGIELMKKNENNLVVANGKVKTDDRIVHPIQQK
jgi:hypothetical protein